MSDDPKEWRWVGEDGAQKTLSEQELIAELSSESLPHYTLVWRKGWAEWLPAMQVAELAWVLPPGKADDPATPKERASATAPPAPPLYRYPVIKRRAQNLKSDKPPPERPVALPRPKPEESGSKPVTPAEKERAPAEKEHAPAEKEHAPAEKEHAPAEKEHARTEKEHAPAPPPEAEKVEADAAPVVETVPLAPVTEASEPTQPRADQPGSLDSQDFVSRPSDAPTVEPDDEIHEVEAELEDSRPFATSDVLPPGSGSAAAYAYGDEDNAETRVLPGRALPTGEATYVAPHAPPAAEDPSLSAHPPPMEAMPQSEPPGEGEEDLGHLPRLPPPPPAPAGFSEYAQAPRTGPPPYVYALVALVAVLAISLVFTASDEEPETATPATTPEPSAAITAPAPSGSAEAAAEPCEVTRAAVKLAMSAFPGVQPNFARVPGSERLAVGFADGKRAYGMTLDPKTLDHDQVFEQKKRAQVITATPTTSHDKLAFFVVRSKDDLSPAAVVDASPPFVLGLHDGALARVPADDPDQKPQTIWNDVFKTITTPRIAAVEGTGYAVTFRVGGKDGKVMTGWTTRDGAMLSRLVAVQTDAEFLGTPDVGGNEEGALVAFAARKPGASTWGIQTVRLPRGGDPAPATWFAVPEGGPGDSAISPLVAGLSDKRWLLVWTEGSAGGRVVRLQVLNESAKPVGPATRISPDGTNAGQGAVWVRGNDAAVLFFVEGVDEHELWGAAVGCPAAP